jgi:hypothetical protein
MIQEENKTRGKISMAKITGATRPAGEEVVVVDIEGEEEVKTITNKTGRITSSHADINNHAERFDSPLNFFSIYYKLMYFHNKFMRQYIPCLLSITSYFIILTIDFF